MKEKLKDLCNSKRMTFHQVEQALGFGNGTLAKSDIEKISYMRIVAITSFLGLIPITFSIPQNQLLFNLSNQNLNSFRGHTIRLLKR